MIHGDITKDPWKSRRKFFPWNPSMAKVDCRDARKAQERRHRFQVMLAMNYIRGRRHRVQISNDWNCGGSDFLCHFSQPGAVRNRCMAAVEQPNRQIPYVEL
jgi:hypothetical protein